MTKRGNAIKRILFHWPQDDGCGHYRTKLPCRHLAKPLAKPLADEGIQVFFDNHLGEATNSSDGQPVVWDAVVVGRLVPDDVTLWLLRQKAKGTKIVWDIDDDLWNVPDWSEAYGLVDHPALKQMPALADHVWVSTAPLEKVLTERFCQYGQRGGLDRSPIVLPNLMDPLEWPEPPPRSDDPNRIVRLLWAGSPTHRHDLDLIVDPLSNILEQYRGKVELILAGDVHPELMRRHPWGVFHCPMMPIASWRHELVRLAPDIVVAPLADHPFNRAKSAIRFYEATMAGAACVVSPGPAYSCIRPSETGYRADTPAQWSFLLNGLVRQSALRRSASDAARQYTLANASWLADCAGKRAWLDAIRLVVGD